MHTPAVQRRPQDILVCSITCAELSILLQAEVALEDREHHDA